MLASLTVRMPSIIIMKASADVTPLLTLLQKEAGCIFAIADHENVMKIHYNNFIS